MRINTNISAMNTYSRLTAANNSKSGSLAKLSSGLRINKAGDDAAGLAISEKMRGQIGGLKQATRNAQDAISLIQTAEGGLNETHSILNRMRDLAVQSSNDTNTNDDRKEIQEEMNQLATEISRISKNTEFNTQNLLGGEFKAKFHIGANTGQSIDLSISAMDANALKVDGAARSITTAATGELQGIKITAANGTNYEIVIEQASSAKSLDAQLSGNKLTVTLGHDGTDPISSTLTAVAAKINELEEFSATTEAAGNASAGAGASVTLTGGKSTPIEATEAGINVSTQEAADSAIAIIDEAVKTVSAERSKLGATQNRLDHTINNLTATSENLSEAESRIRDVDMAEEMMEFTKSNILSQAATSMLAQANQMPQGVLQLLQ